MKENNNKIRSLTGKYKQIELECWEGIREKLERMKKLCEERNSLYEKQNELKSRGRNWRGVLYSNMGERFICPFII